MALYDVQVRAGIGFAVLALGCGASTRPPPGCADEDGDGFGVGMACEGPDACDGRADAHTDDECDAMCTEPAAGCPCDSVEPITCYGGAPETAGIGACHPGTSACTNGTWGACEREHVPEIETCNGLDDDCDGTVDEGLLSECGVCTPCEDACLGADAGCTPFEIADGARVLWIPDRTEGTVVAFDTVTRTPRGAYWPGPPNPDLPGGGLLPHAVAVDGFGDAVVSTEGPPLDASLTRIASDPARCRDRHSDGRIETSTARDDLLDFSTHESWDDECVVWSQRLPIDSGPAALVLFDEVGLDGARDSYGFVLSNWAERFVKFDASSGDFTGDEIDVPGFHPYDGAIDPDGYLWALSSGGQVPIRFDASDPSPDVESFPLSADAAWITVDEDGTPWIALQDAWRFDAGSSAFVAAGLPIGDSSVYGLAADMRGSVWVGAHYDPPVLYRFDVGGLAYDTMELPLDDAANLAADLDGGIWAVGLLTGRIELLAPGADATERVLCGGVDCIGETRLVGDPTGIGFTALFGRPAIWTARVDGCDAAETVWADVVLDATFPEGASIEVSIRAADAADSIASSPSVSLGVAPIDGATFSLAGQSARILELRLALRAAPAGEMPAVRRANVRFSCP